MGSNPSLFLQLLFGTFFCPGKYLEITLTNYAGTYVAFRVHHSLLLSNFNKTWNVLKFQWQCLVCNFSGICSVAQNFYNFSLWNHQKCAINVVYFTTKFIWHLNVYQDRLYTFIHHFWSFPPIEKLFPDCSITLLKRRSARKLKMSKFLRLLVMCLSQLLAPFFWTVECLLMLSGECTIRWWRQK